MSNLIARNVNFVYSVKGEPSVQALKDVNLAIKEGEFVVAIGASGCGKTTLLNLFAGFLRPTDGDILYINDSAAKTGDTDADTKTKEVPIEGPDQDRGVVFGEDPVLGPGSDRGVVFQKHALLPWLTVVQNAAFGLKLQGIPAKERYDTALRNLSLVGLEDFIDHKIYQLSGGMQQRVGIARALTSNPSTLLMDEPLGALDALTRENTQELILDIWQKTGKQVFFITHSVEEALFMATKLIVMSPRPGRITHTFDLDFCHKYLKIRDARKIKSDQKFIQMRETVLEIVYTDEKSA